MAEDKKISQLTEEDIRFVFQEHGRVCFELQAMKGEILRLQAIIASISNSHAGNVVEAEAPHAEVAQ